VTGEVCLKFFKNMKRLFLLTAFVFLIVSVYGQGTQVGDSSSPIYHYNGNVGIGITNPSSLLEVNGGVFSWINGVHEAMFTTPGGHTGLVFNVNNLGDRTRFNIFNVSNADVSNRYVSLYYNDDGSSKGLTIRKGGNIGIGTITPSERLEIYGGGNLLIRGSANDAGDLIFRKSDHSQLGRIWTNSSGSSGMYLSSGDNNSDLTIYSNGNVGIGTISPDYKLDVLGTIRANEVKVATGWSDFVFEPDYDLPTLQEVENYIDQNGHLPDIPSAEEVKANGISLGEMDAKLLQKIEELTLYSIHQESEIIKLNHEIDQLKEMIKDILKN
jgi:hypothetical protein